MAEKRVAVVTGGASGIGEAVVRRFAEAGWSVVSADVNEARGAPIAAELGGDCSFQRLDVYFEHGDRAVAGARSGDPRHDRARGASAPSSRSPSRPAAALAAATHRALARDAAWRSAAPASSPRGPCPSAPLCDSLAAAEAGRVPKDSPRAGAAVEAAVGPLAGSMPRAARAASVTTRVTPRPSPVGRQTGASRPASTSATKPLASKAPTTFWAAPPFRRAHSGPIRSLIPI